MDRLSFLLLGIAVFFLLPSCQEDDMPLLNSDTTQVVFEHTGGSQTIRIESDADWSIYGLPDWITVSVYSGINTQDVTLTTIENYSGMEREHELTIRTNDSQRTVTVKVSQHANALGRVLEIDNAKEKIFNGETSIDTYEDSVVINSTLRWTIIGPSWLSCTFKNKVSPMNGEFKEGSGTLYLRGCISNYDMEARKDTVIIQSESGDITHRIPVVQMGAIDLVPVNMVVLTDAFFCNFKYGQFVESFSYDVYDNALSEALQAYGLLNPRIENSVGKKAKATRTQFLAYSGISSDTDYNIYLVPKPNEVEDEYYDTLYHTKIHTPSEIGQPRAAISDVYVKDGKWYYSVTMNQYAHGYYFSILSGNFIGKSKGYIAYRLYNLIKAGNIKLYTTNANAIQNRSDDIILASWAVGADGKLSEAMDIYRASNSE